MNGRIGFQQLQAGEVLLYHGRGWVARAIRFLDGSEASHAALYLGGSEVAESGRGGVERRTLGESCSGAKWVIARRLRAPLPLRPVVQVGQRYAEEGSRFAYEQILLLALIALARRLPPAPGLGALLRRVFEAAAWFVGELTARANGGLREPLLSSELVFRCFEEADERGDDDWELAIPRERSSRPAPGHPERANGGAVARGSLIDLAARRPQLAEPPSPTAARARPRPVPAWVLDEAVRRYLKEAKSPQAAVGAKPLLDDPLAAALDGFAAALERHERLAYGTNGSRSSFAILSRQVGELVTPGDLLRSGSLFDLGQVV